MSGELKKGLEGVFVTESGLTDIDGDVGRMVYRGYDIGDLAREATYEEVLYLLWNGHLPDRSELLEFESLLANHRSVADGVIAEVERLAAADEEPMAALRTAVSTLSAYDEDADADAQDVEANRRKAHKITAKMPTIVAAFTRLCDGKEPVAPNPNLGHAANFLYMLTDEEPGEVLAETFDIALVLHADHGLNASTFAAMVTASTLADVHSAITSAVGTLGGPLHGGANANVMRMLKTVDDSGKDPVEWVQAALEDGERVPGFGHRVYNVKDPRAVILGEMSAELAEATGDTKWYDYSLAIEEYITAEKGLAPNVDFYSASTYYQMGIPIDVFTPIFAMSRVGGWLAHVIEQFDDNRLIRPRARYVGQNAREFVQLDER